MTTKFWYKVFHLLYLGNRVFFSYFQIHMSVTSGVIHSFLHFINWSALPLKVLSHIFTKLLLYFQAETHKTLELWKITHHQNRHQNHYQNKLCILWITKYKVFVQGKYSEAFSKINKLYFKKLHKRNKFVLCKYITIHITLL